MVRYFKILIAISLIFSACKKENKLTKTGEMLFLKHKGASMPVLVRGNFDSDVILLIVHGGAGGSSGGQIEDFKNFIEPKYMVAYWDQRHAGASQDNFDKDELTIDLMAEDMLLVIRMLKHKYGSNKKVFAFCPAQTFWFALLGVFYFDNHCLDDHCFNDHCFNDYCFNDYYRDNHCFDDHCFDDHCHDDRFVAEQSRLFFWRPQQNLRSVGETANFY
jgi:hypothetical protein